MKTRELLSGNAKDVIAALKAMKIKALETHAQKILALLGQDDYDAVMLALIQRIQTLTPDEDRLAEVKAIVVAHLPEDFAKENSATADRDESIHRLCVLMTLLVAKKFVKVHAGLQH